MTKASQLYRTAERVVHEGMAVQAGESAVVVTDDGRPAAIADALMAALRAADAEGVLVRMNVQLGRKEPPAPVRAAIASATVVLAPTTVSLTYSDTLLEARGRGARVMTMPLISEPTFVRAGTVVLEELAATTRAVAARLGRGRRLRLTSREGTDLNVELGGHAPEFIDGLCRAPGDYDQVPAGVASVLAIKTEGVIVADASASHVGSLGSPLRVEVRDSRIVAVEGGAEAADLLRWLGAAQDPQVYHCAAEVGVGTNRWARHVSSPVFSMEGVRVRGWVHVGFGDNHSLPGGWLTAKLHGDLLLSKCRLEIDGEALAEDGRLLGDQS